MTRRIESEARLVGLIDAMNAHFGRRDISGYEFPVVNRGAKNPRFEYWLCEKDGVPALFFEVTISADRRRVSNFAVVAIRRSPGNARAIIALLARLLRRFESVSLFSTVGDRYRAFARLFDAGKTRRGMRWHYCLSRGRSLPKIRNFLLKMK